MHMRYLSERSAFVFWLGLDDTDGQLCQVAGPQPPGDNRDRRLLLDLNRTSVPEPWLLECAS